MFDKEKLAELLVKAQGKRSISEYGRRAEVSPSYLSLLIRQLRDNPPAAKTLKALADVAHNDVTYTDFLDAAGLLPVDMQGQLARIDELKELREAYHTAESKLKHAADPVKFIRVPLLGDIAAGQPLLAEDHIIEWELFPDFGHKENEVFSLIVKGDSMIGARIFEGDKVLVHIQPEVEDGEIAVVNVDGEKATLKRVKRINGKVLLLSENPRYDPMVIDSEDARICGKVIQVLFDPNSKK